MGLGYMDETGYMAEAEYMTEAGYMQKNTVSSEHGIGVTMAPKVCHRLLRLKTRFYIYLRNKIDLF